MKRTYSRAFIEQALVKLYSREKRTVKSVADELNVNHHTLKNWMKSAAMKRTHGITAQEKRPQDWSAAEQLAALHESHALSGESLARWCRERGLFAHHLSAWTAAFCRPGDVSPGRTELRGLKAENERLKRELVRKEKALSEAAALLILQKKFRALWEDNEVEVT